METAPRAWVTEVCAEREHLGPQSSLSYTAALTALSCTTLLSETFYFNLGYSIVSCAGAMALTARVHAVSVRGVGLRENGVSSLRVQGLSGAAMAVQSPRRSAGAASAEMGTETTSAAVRLHYSVCCVADKEWVDHVLPRCPEHSRTSGKQTVL